MYSSQQSSSSSVCGMLGPNNGLLEFVKTANQKQTIIANNEGSYGRRILDIDDTERLELFIGCTLEYERFLESGATPDVIRLTNRIKDISRRFNLRGKIHYCAIWVIYFIYDGGTTVGNPVFKVYKKEVGDDAVFVDIHGRMYDNWQEFLEKENFYESFLCVPRNGKYVFSDYEGSKKLDLIYIRSQSNLKFPRRIINRKSFSIRIFEWISDGLPYVSDKVMPYFKEAVRFLENTWKNNKELILSVLGIVLIVGGGITIACLSEQLSLAMLGNFFQSFSRMLLDNAKTFLLSNLGSLLLCVPENPEQLKGEEDSVFKQFLEELPYSERTKKMLEIMLKFIFKAVNTNASKNVSPTEGKNRQNEEGNFSATNEKLRQKLDKYIKLHPVESVEDLANEIVEDIKKSDSEEPIFVPVADEFTGSIYAFKTAYMKNIKEQLSKMFGSYKLYPKHSMVHDVTDLEGKVIATLYFYSEKSAFLWVRDKGSIIVGSNAVEVT